MPDRFLETDEILYQLVLELEKYKSTSEQLSLTKENVGDLLAASERLVALCGQLVERNKQQLDTTIQLANDTENRINLVLNGQHAFVTQTEKKLSTLAYALATNENTLNGVADILETHNKEQLDATHQLVQAAALTEEKLNALASTLETNERVTSGIVETVEKHSEQLDTVKKVLQHEVEPLIKHINGIAGATRVATLILLALVLINGALAAYIIRLLSS